MLRAVLLGIGLFCAVFPVRAAEPPIANVENPPRAANAVIAFWTQVVPGQVDARKPSVEARFVLMMPQDSWGLDRSQWTSEAAKTCPNVAVNGGAENSVAAARGAMMGRIREATADGYRRGERYLVAICAAPLDPNADVVSLTGIADPETILTVYPDAAPARVAGPGQLGRKDGSGQGLSAIFIADSGCRGKTGTPGSRFYQDCADTGPDKDSRSAWPLARMAAAAAALDPDLVIHGGDHHYFYEDADFWKSGSANSGDRFEYWLQEFLNPAQRLLLAAPFAFVRGNHERCEDGWFGDGWFKMFAPPAETACTASSKTWAFDVAPSANPAIEPYRFYVIDTSTPSAAAASRAFQDPVAQALGPAGKKSWLSHYPPIKLVFYQAWAAGQQNTPHTGDANVQNAVKTEMAACKNGAACWPALVLTGHQHLFQDITLRDPASEEVLTRVVVAGHGGTVLDFANLPQTDPSPAPASLVHCTYEFEQGEAFGKAKVSADLKTSSRHGFLHLVRVADGPGWSIEPKWYPSAPPPDLFPSDGGPVPCNP